MIFALFIACSSSKQANSQCATGSSPVFGDSLSFLENSCAQLALRPSVIATGEVDLRFEQHHSIDGAWVPIVSSPEGAELEAVVLTGSYQLQGTDPTRLWKQGYQSWWWSGVTELTDTQFDENNLPLVGGDAGGTSASDEQPWASWWNGLVGRADGESLLLGALAATKTRVWSAFSEDQAWFVWGGRGDPLALSPGEEQRLDPIWVGSDSSAFSLQRRYAEAAADHHELEVRVDQPPVGWATWYTFYEHIDESIIRSNLEVAVTLAENSALEPMSVFQIDDGWQRAWGEWQAADDFPSGMAALASDISAAGFTPGLWMAPFYVSTDTAIYEDQPDWWVRDANGEPITYSNFGSNSYAIIDATHPDAGAWMQAQVTNMVDAGWRYFKLDFLYAGAEIGQRYADVTAMEAFHIGMELLKEATGEYFFLACGAPMLPSLGYADGFRTGADIGFGFDPGPRRGYLRWQLRATAARSWQNQLWWWVDPDQILLREPFDAVERTGSLVANLASGGAWLIGDDLTTLPEEILEEGLEKSIVGLRGAIAEPLNPLAFPSGMDLGPVSELGEPNDNPPTTYRLSSGETLFINLTDQPVTVEGVEGIEHFSGEQGARTPRVIQPGAGELWR